MQDGITASQKNRENLLLTAQSFFIGQNVKQGINACFMAIHGPQMTLGQLKTNLNEEIENIYDTFRDFFPIFFLQWFHFHLF